MIKSTLSLFRNFHPPNSNWTLAAIALDAAFRSESCQNIHVVQSGLKITQCVPFKYLLIHACCSKWQFLKDRLPKVFVVVYELVLLMLC